MIELYHFGLSTCSQKVRLVLAEKGLEFESHEVNLMAGEQHDPAYVKLNPNHVVPTLVHDGQVLIESSLIIKYLDDAFPAPPMRPHDALGRYAVDRWLMHADEALHRPRRPSPSRSVPGSSSFSSPRRCAKRTSRGSRIRSRARPDAA